MATIEARGYANRSETKTSKGGKVYSTFSLGVKQKEKAFGDKPESVTWMNLQVTDFSGQQPPEEKAFVTVKGYLKERKYTKDGQQRTSLEVVATEVVVSPPLDGGSSHKPAGSSDEKDPWE